MCDWEIDEQAAPPLATMRSREAVCGSERGPATWQPWRIPSGVHHARLNPSGWLRGGAPRILARNETWLPVVHQRSASKKVAGRDFGMWFYFALGCSDVYAAAA